MKKYVCHNCGKEFTKKKESVKFKTIEGVYMTKAKYIEKYGDISNREFKIAQEMVRDYNVKIEDWNKPAHTLLSQANINLMIMLRLHIDTNCRDNFKNSFWKMCAKKNNRGVYAVNYTGNTLDFNGSKFSGDYPFCILNKSKKINIENEKLYLIDGSYPIYSVTSCLEQDIARVKSTNPSYWIDDPIAIEVIAYNYNNYRYFCTWLCK